MKVIKANEAVTGGLSFSPASRIILIESVSIHGDNGFSIKFQSRKQDYFN